MKTMKIERNTMPFLTFIQIVVLFFSFLSILLSSNTDNPLWLLLLIVPIILTVWAVFRIKQVKKEYILLEGNAITAHLYNGNKKIVKLSAVKKIMYTTSRVTANNKVNRNFLFVELRDAKHQNLMRITKKSFKQEQLLEVIKYLNEDRKIEIVEE